MSILQQVKRRNVYLAAAVFLTVIGIIVAVSNMPADSFSRAQVSEGLNISGEAKATVTEYYLEHNQFPSDNASAGLPPAEDIQGKYVLSVRINEGEIVITYGNDANSNIHGDTLILRPEFSERRVTWVCSSLDIVPKNLPSACRPDHDNR